ncbi:MAG: hypothetical protein IPH37_13330 [Burkholderiales bacterium]|nr:hypothetical protein [Burkholderiales bacterium]
MCAAVGRPDEHAGEVPVAYVQLRPGVSCQEKGIAGICGPAHRRTCSGTQSGQDFACVTGHGRG